MEIRQDERLIAKRRPELYANKIILAPMVRENSLPFRLLCLKYGADLVYTEELIDYRLCECKRIENNLLGTIDFVDERGEVILRVCPEERDRLILQLGSNNPTRAIQVAKLTRSDVAGLDFNFGCPKSFSLKGGMGAAMLEKPDQIKELLTTCVENLDIPVTCKIRLLPDVHKTIELVKIIESCGVSAIAVHGRTKEQRPQHENQDDVIKRIVETVSIPVIANGGSNSIKSYDDIMKFRERTTASSVMIARIAMRNPSIFRSNNQMDPIKDVLQEFIKLCVRYDNSIANSKYAIQSMLKAGCFGGDFLREFHQTFNYKTFCDLFEISSWYEENKLSAYRSKFHDVSEIEGDELEQFISDKLKDLNLDNLPLVNDSIPYISRFYDPVTPKAQLMNHIGKAPQDERPEFITIERKQNRYYCIIKYKQRVYLNKTFSSSKRHAEQASAL